MDKPVGHSSVAVGKVSVEVLLGILLDVLVEVLVELRVDNREKTLVFRKRQYPLWLEHREPDGQPKLAVSYPYFELNTKVRSGMEGITGSKAFELIRPAA